MDLRFNEQQEILRTMARKFLVSELPKSKIKEIEESEEGHSTEVWRKMAALGWMGLIIPEDYGGMGYSFQDLTVLLEEMGRNICPGPFFCTAMSALTILDRGTEAQKKRFLPKIANGELIVTNDIMENEGLTEDILEASSSNSGYVINGTRLFVEMAHIADYFLCTASTKDENSKEEGMTLFILDSSSSNICCNIIPTIGMNKLCEVEFNHIFVPQENILGELNNGRVIVEKAIEKSVIAKCAESIGAMQAVMEMTVNYSKERIQYDKPIGSFQALQFIMANMWVAIETSRYLVYEAAWMESEGIPCSKEASMAKAIINEAYRDVAQWAVRLHGALGTTREHDVSLYYRRSREAASSFGSTDFHREKVFQAINAQHTSRR